MSPNVEVRLIIANDITIGEFNRSQAELDKFLRNSRYLKQVVSDIKVEV